MRHWTIAMTRVIGVGIMIAVYNLRLLLFSDTVTLSVEIHIL